MNNFYKMFTQKSQLPRGRMTSSIMKSEIYQLKIIVSLVFILVLCHSNLTSQQSTAQSKLYADFVSEYIPNPSCFLQHPDNDTERIIGEPDSRYITLGNNGHIIIDFEDNILVNGGDDEFDLKIYKTGSILVGLHPADEETKNLLDNLNIADNSQDDGFYYFGLTGPNGIDIDGYQELPKGSFRYDKVKIVDWFNACDVGKIDAVEALNYANHYIGPLMDFYQSTGGANWVNNSGWTSNNCDPCGLISGTPWFGIDCSYRNFQGQTVIGDYVDRLELESNNLIGSIPTSIGQLDLLGVIYLDRNNLVGEIPKEIGDLSILRYLDLTGNDLTGALPPELGQLAFLQILTLNGNLLSGSIPREYGNMTSMVLMSIAANMLSGIVPGELGNLSQLSTLNLGGNNLNCLEEGLETLCGSTYVTLHNNPINTPWDFQTFCAQSPVATQCITTSCLGDDRNALVSFFNATRGISWHDRTNWLSGCDPCSWYGISCNTDGRVIGIDLQTNNLTGSLPAELAQLEYLANLKLGVNNLYGPIPPELGQLQYLVNFWVQFNDYTNQALPEFENPSGPVLPAIDRLYFYVNDFTGPIPAQYGGFESLTVLRTYNNPNLSGCYDSKLANLCDPNINLTNADISDGTGLDASWKDFCTCGAGICPCGDTNKWLGGTQSSNWYDKNQWSLGHVPRACEAVLIQSADDVLNIPNYTFIYTLEIKNGAQVTIPNDHTVLTDILLNNWKVCPVYVSPY